MLFTYESTNLLYNILDTSHAEEILAFYYDNKDFFEPYEPEKPSGFYTLAYQETITKLEFENFLRGKAARYWITRKTQPDKLIGCVTFGNIVRGSFLSCNIGYKIHKDYMRIGYGSEAVTFLTNMMFTDAGLHRIEAYIHPDNFKSIALATHCGFTFDGVAKEYVLIGGKWCDHSRYTLLSD